MFANAEEYFSLFAKHCSLSCKVRLRRPYKYLNNCGWQSKVCQEDHFQPTDVIINCNIVPPIKFLFKNFKIHLGLSYSVSASNKE